MCPINILKLLETNFYRLLVFFMAWLHSVTCSVEKNLHEEQKQNLQANNYVYP